MEHLRTATPAPAVEGHPDHLATFLHDPVGCMAGLHARYGDAAYFRKGAGRAVFVFAPEYNRQVLNTPEVFYIVSRFPGPRNSAQRRFGKGLFSMNGDEHQQHRRMLMPPFKKGHLDSYHEPLVRLVNDRLATWKAGAVIDLIREMKEITLKMTTSLLFGVELDDNAHGIEALFDEWLDTNHVVSFAAQLPVETPPGCYEQLLDVATRLEVALNQLVASRRGWETGKDVLAILLQARAAGAIGDLEVLGQVITTFNAAYHTTTYALTWALFLLAQHPDYLRRVVEAELSPLGGGPPTPAGLAEMPLLERATRESLRLLPPVVFLPRITASATTLAGVDVPVGSMVLVSPYVTQHRGDIFPEPNRYDPDRWQTGVSPYAYLPFGGGHRLCIGAPFAQNVLKIALAIILQRFRLEVVPGSVIDRHGTLTLGAKDGVPVRLHEPDGNFTASPVAGTIREMVDLPT